MRIDNDGVGLEVAVDGPDDGPHVLFLHGISGSRRRTTSSSRGTPATASTASTSAATGARTGPRPPT